MQYESNIVFCTSFDLPLKGKAKFSDLLIPWATFTEPEVAHVGLYPRDMEAQGIAYETMTKTVRRYRARTHTHLTAR